MDEEDLTLEEMRRMREEIRELRSMFAQQKELEEKKAIILGEDAVEVLKALTQRVKEGRIKGRVILLHDDDIIPYEAINKARIGLLGNNIPDPETEGEAVERGAKTLKRIVDRELDRVGDDFKLPFMVKGQGGEGQKSLQSATTLWHSAKILRDACSLVNFGPRGVEIDLFMEAFHFGMLEMHRTMYELTLQAKFLDMGTSQVKLPKTFVIEVSKAKGSEEERRRIVQDEIARRAQESAQKTQEAILRSQQALMSGNIRRFDGQGQRGQQQQWRGGRGRAGRGRGASNTERNPQPNESNGGDSQ